MTESYNVGGAPWWRAATFYQIFPASFQDSDGDGWGDLNGILRRVDHLTDLGVDAVWLSPLQPSPMLDGNCDIADFRDIDPSYGDLAAFDALLAELHRRGLRVVLDFVPNHTSDRHSWFQESRAARDSAKRDWYVWAEPDARGGPPNNWLSRFGGSAWTFDETTRAYYYHAFLKEQTDLNWRCAAVREEMKDTLRFWLRRGLDGVRVDACGALVEDALLRDDPPDVHAGAETPPPQRLKRAFTDGRPESLDCLEELRRTLDAHPDRVMLGEADTAPERVGAFYGDAAHPRLHLPLNYHLLDTPWSAVALAATLDLYLRSLPPGACPTWALGGHDMNRIAGRIGPARARVAAMLHFALPGATLFYMGDEIGMPSVPIPKDRRRDPYERLTPGFGLDRDPQRAPMRWSAARNAGFTSGEPWLPIGSGFEEVNVDTQRRDPRSHLNLYRRLIRLKRQSPALREGESELRRGPPDVLEFRRRAACGPQIAAWLNIAAEARRFAAPRGQVLLSTGLDREGELVDGELWLRGDEGLLVALS